MDSDDRPEERNVSFVMRLWQEQDRKRLWRGRIIEVEGQHSCVFQHERGLLTFVQTHLLRLSGTKLRK
jgi:hypothetical protein